MGASLGGFGDVVFEVSADTVRTIERFQRESAAIYADHMTGTGKPSSEFTGLDLDQISLTMTLHLGLGLKPADEVDRLIEMKDSGKAHPLLLGTKVYGFFTIRKVSETVETFLGAIPAVVRVELSIKEYDDPASGPGSEAARRDAANRGVTGKGGPPPLPGGKPTTAGLSLTPGETP
ncbi:MAG: phage tail protein [Planctomycetaceae bacterium]|nr:phage tail protein [Planctomycetaceae bacterium]